MEASFLDGFPWIALSYIYTLLEAVAVRDFFDIVLYRKPLKKRYFTLAVFLLFFMDGNYLQPRFCPIFEKYINSAVLYRRAFCVL